MGRLENGRIIIIIIIICTIRWYWVGYYREGVGSEEVLGLTKAGGSRSFSDGGSAMESVISVVGVSSMFLISVGVISICLYMHEFLSHFSTFMKF